MQEMTKCLNCGGDLEKTSDGLRLICPYCNSVFETDDPNAGAASQGNEDDIYKNALEFSEAHGELEEFDNGPSNISWADLLKGMVKYAKEDFEREIVEDLHYRYPDLYPDPYALEESIEILMEKWRKDDEARPDVSTLPFQPLPASKIAGMKKKLMGKEWNAFIDEVNAGRAEFCEILILSIIFDEREDSYLGPRGYVKVADQSGRVYKGGVPALNRFSRVYYPEDLGGWMSPEDYEDRFKFREDEEYEAYEVLYYKKAQQDPVQYTDDRKHGYLIHFHVGGEDRYAVAYEKEFNDPKELMKGVSDLYDYPGIMTDRIFEW